MKLGLVIDLDTCVGCHACATACKQWNTSGTIGPLSDQDAYGRDPNGSWLNRIRTFEVQEQIQEQVASPCSSTSIDLHAMATDQTQASKTVHMPMSCMQCEDADCVTVCPTGASYKRDEDGIVLVDQDKCMGCNLCAWACPYGARELDEEQGVMKKCTLCVDRIYDENLVEADRQPACVLSCPTSSRVFGDFDDPSSKVSKLVVERNGQSLMPELGYKPTNQYLPPRAQNAVPMADKTSLPALASLKKWANKVIAR